MRVDSVHQGDLDKEKGVYYINMVDEVTQSEFVFCVPQICERYLKIVLEIKHHVLTPGISGDFVGITPYKDPEKTGYVYVRYRRDSGQGDEFGWTGQGWAIFSYDDGQTHVGEPFQMEGVIFIKLPESTAKLVGVVIQHPDGEMRHNLQSP
ncbi:hypothetical protein HZA42_06090 [Candidatus Peregrinibacteria bacterium]|nr:hypothetical protein [Candidatus Peregrinibacteria bacterium]